ncbi:MAG: proton-conducting transporter membrane subunit [Candidatus Aenigmarchaeota archaeon]
MLEYVVAVLIIAAFLMLVLRRDLIAIGAILISFFMMVVLFFQGEIAIVRFGGWAPPFGIVWVMDGLSLFIGLLVTGISSLVAVYSIKYIKERKHRFYTLLCLMTAGLLGVCLTGDIFNLYVFFEILSIASYGLVSFFLDEDAIEGAFKYIIMGSFGSSFILLGITLLYGLTGTLNFADLALKISHSPIFMIALGLIIGGFALKAAIIPFHAWKPDAIEGTPAPMGAIFTTASSAIGVYGIMRILFIFGLIQLNFALIGFGVLTMMVGALLALVQLNVKRMLAYSSISQMGYVVMVIGFGTTLGLTSGLYHILNNTLIKGLLFMGIGCVIYLTKKENLNEMGINNTPLLICMGIGVLSMAGIPPLNGFVSKWLIFMASWEINPILTILAILASAITLAYGLKIFSSIFLTEKRFGGGIPKIMLIPVIILTVLCVLIGIFPQLGLSIVEPAANALLNQNQYITAVLGG